MSMMLRLTEGVGGLEEGCWKTLSQSIGGIWEELVCWYSKGPFLEETNWRTIWV